jgi:hypothetical protein
MVTSAPGATVDSGTLVWDDGALAAGASVTHNVTFTAGAGVDSTIALGGVTQSALYDPVPANNGAITTVQLGP